MAPCSRANGIRTKLSKREETAADFVIEGPANHGMDDLVLTPCLAIADEVGASLV
jgi:hypothetical protein